MDASNKFKKWKPFDFGIAEKPPVPVNRRGKKKVTSSTVENNKPPQKKPNSNRTFDIFKEAAPKLPSDLAVHPKKKLEVTNWLTENVLQPKSTIQQSILLLHGPSGTAKSTTVKVLCKSLGISVIEWISPIDVDYEYTRENQVSRFVEFLSDSKYKSLFETEANDVTMVKDFPNAFIRQPERLAETLRDIRYVTNKPFVFVCSDTCMFRSLFPEEVIKEFDMHVISFNPSAPTLLKSAITRAQELIREKCDYAPPKDVVDAIIATSMGDIRSAIYQLYLACSSSNNDLPLIEVTPDTRTAENKKRKRRVDFYKVRGMEKSETLGLFHALGRVLNPKWSEEGDRKKLKCDIDGLVGEFSSLPETFTAFLFENYLKYFGSLQDVVQASDCLSNCTTFITYYGEKQDILPYSLWISILGLMVNNKHKVSKWNQIHGPVKINKNIDKQDVNRHYDASEKFYCNIIKNNSTSFASNFLSQL